MNPQPKLAGGRGGRFIYLSFITLRLIVVLAIIAGGLSACDPRVGRALRGDNWAAKLTPTVAAETVVAETEEAAATLTPAAPTTTPTPAPVGVFLPPYLPAALKESLALPEGYILSATESGTDLKVDVFSAGQEGPVLADWVYALVVPFPTLLDEVTLEDARNLWRGGPTGDLQVKGLMMDDAAFAVFEKLWSPATSGVQVVDEEDLLEAAWQEHEIGLPVMVLVPFETLDPRWKVLVVDGQSPVRKGFQGNRYGLTIRYGLAGDVDRIAEYDGLGDGPERITNRDEEQLTTVMLTGVTALVRGTAAKMEFYGNDFPAEFTGDTLREADILHINNEIAFWTTCPEPYNWPTLIFCSRPKYIELLESIGTDVVEMSGDHLQDWGKEAAQLTFEMYAKRGWPVYGGGVNIEEGQKPALFEHNGNKIAFLGCSAKPEGYSGATETDPGAVHCDFDQLVKEIRRVKAAGYLPIVTFQHLEYYQYSSHPILEADFKKVAQAGAVIVSGSQAHQAHAMAFNPFTQNANRKVSFLHYGLGNLFFDQFIFGPTTSQSFLDRHVIYDGRYISTELLTIMFINDAQARFMTVKERSAFLTIIFNESGW